MTTPYNASTGSAATDELVVLLDDGGRAVGTADKRSVHHGSTPLHLAFSCYVFDATGRLLVTRRALEKPTFPGAWTNSACGHPRPGERLRDAVSRRVHEELGLALHDLRIVLPLFRYRATGPNGAQENEICPVFTARTAEQPRPDDAEVAATRWEPWSEFSAGVLDGSREVSPWCREQVPQLVRLGADPLLWAGVSPSTLPLAAL